MSPTFNQFFTVICCNLLTLACGTAFGLVVSHESNEFFDHSKLIKNHTNDTIGKIEEITLSENPQYFCALIGYVMGCFAIQPISLMIGIKRTIHLLILPLVFGAVAVYFRDSSFYLLYTSVVLLGFVLGGLPVAIPTFINDISHDKYRGALCSIFDVSFSIGLLFSIFLQITRFPIFLYMIGAIVVIAVITFVIVLYLLPESPEFLQKRNQEFAVRSCVFYKGSLKTLESNRSSPKLSPNHIEDGRSRIVHSDARLNAKLTLKDFYNRQAIKAYFISFTSLALSIIPAVFAILIIEFGMLKSNPFVYPRRIELIIFIITHIFASIIFGVIVERVSRKKLYVWSGILAAIAYFANAIFSPMESIEQESHAGNVMYILSLMCIIFFSCLGLRSIPYILTIEVFPKKIRQTFIALAFSIVGISLFILGRVFLLIYVPSTIDGCITIVGFLCVVNAAFGYYFIPRTQGKSHQEIMGILKK